LSQVLPNQAVTVFEQQVQAELSQLAPPVAQSTEVLRMVRQRLGQQAYRQAMLDYWGGACAVTGLALAPVLRASHAKPWAVCDSDAERLDIFNGLLLAAHLDALFDQFFLSFDEHGRALISPQLDAAACEVMGLRPTMRMRWMAPEHQRYMGYHRQRFLTGP
jgi:predicted restriction endonuclease